MRRNFLLLRGLLLALNCWSTFPAAAAPISRNDPESTDPGRKGISTAKGSAVVVTANPLASAAALAVLKDGGSAIDCEREPKQCLNEQQHRAHSHERRLG